MSTKGMTGFQTLTQDIGPSFAPTHGAPALAACPDFCGVKFQRCGIFQTGLACDRIQRGFKMRDMAFKKGHAAQNEMAFLVVADRACIVNVKNIHDAEPGGWAAG